ncbi:autotransporter-associated beta strand repeat-containing protein [Glaciimonas soli]|uniref:Autotransporter outer membrane beta-barrel domain-containing protein n=1 Tax=Glaciimonas soli TaxID=2590999 RepID=A0A843YVX2_9BURK|nr:autotransporter-associated beta strand repeat-containing protein [Glaciimonas soli]MQR01648.1 autotransporter outer membrane beta-barrel domain-containing protein [Glaciimonas soli]
MNKIYRIVFNHVTGAWVAVAETAKGRAKTKTSTLVSASSAAWIIRPAMLTALGMLAAPIVQAQQAISFPTTGTIDIGSTTNTINALPVSNGAVGTILGVGGTLIYTGATGAFSLGGTTNLMQQSLDMSRLSNFVYDNASQSFSVGGRMSAGSQVTGDTSGTLTLAGQNNTITASVFGVGNVARSVQGGATNSGTVNLGQNNTINADQIVIGNNQASGNLSFQSSIIGGTLVLRGTDGSSAVSNWNISVGGNSNYSATNSLVDLSGGSLDAQVSNLTIGTSLSGSQAATGTLIMGTGTLNTDNILLGRRTTPGTTNAGAAYGTLTVNSGGTVNAQTMMLGDRSGGTNGSASGTLNINGGTVNVQSMTLGNGAQGSGTVNIDSGGTLQAGTIQRNNTGTINWKNGTIGNLADDANMSISGANIVLSSGGPHTFEIDGDNAVASVSSVISGAGQVLTKAGSGILALTGTNTYTGGTTVNDGLVNFQSLANFGTSGNITLNGGGLQWGTGVTTDVSARLNALGTNGAVFDTNGNNVTLAGNLSGAGGGLIKNGDGVLTLTGTNTFDGVSQINQGTLTLGNGGVGGNIAGDVVNNAVLIINQSGTTTLPGVISGDGSLQQNGSGTTVLVNDNTYTGGTEINAGTLQLGNGGSTGSIVGNVANNGALVINQTGTSVLSGTISGTGSLTQSGSGTTVLAHNNTYTGATTIDAGTLQLGDGGTSGSVTGNIANNGTLSLDRSDNFTFSNAVSGNGSLTQAGTGTSTITADNTYTGGTSLNAGILNVSADANLGATTGGLTFNGGALQTSGSFTSDRAVTLNTSGTIDTQANSNTLTGVIAGTGALVKQGSGTLTLIADNTYTGDTAINAGTLQLGNGGTTGSIVGDVLNNGALVVDRSDATTLSGVISGNGSLTQAGAGTTVLTGDNTYTGDTAINAGTLQIGDGGTSGSIAGNVNNNGALIVDRSDALTLGGVISGTGSLTQAGTGTTTLTGVNTYTGGTNLNAGVLNVGSDANLGAAASNLTFNGGTLQTSGSFTSDRAVMINTSGTIDTQGNSNTLTGVIAGVGALDKQGSGTLILTGDNTYGGGTTISAGTLQLGNGGTSGSIVGDVLNNGALVVDRSDATTLSGVISGNGSLTQAGAGTTILTGDNTYTGGTAINAGTLQIGDGGTSGSIAGNVNNNGALIVDRSDALTLSSVISGNGSLTQAGTGTTVLTGTNTYTGDTAINAGTLQIGDGGTSGSIAGNVNNNGALIVDRSDALSLGGVISGTGSLTQAGTGTTTLTGAGSSVGSTNVTAGTLNLAQSGTFTNSGNYTTSGGATTQVGADSTLTVGGVLTQAAGSTLSVDINGNGGQPAITANTANLSGTINIAGYTAPTPPNGDDGLIGTQVNIIRTTGGITNDFTSVNVGGSTTPVDYLSVVGSKSVDGLDYNVGLGLTWFAGANQGNGVFTLANSNEAFNVGVALTDQSASGTPWNGTTLTKNGEGTLTLSGENTYSGGTVINGGTLQIGNGGTSGSIVGDVANNGTLVFNRSDALRYDGIVSGTGALTQAGSGTLTLTGTNTYEGGTNLNAGILNVSADDNLGAATGGLTFNGGTLQTADSFTSDRAVTLNTSGIIDTQDNSNTLTGVIAGVGALAKQGAGTLILTGDNTYSGGTTINAGTLQLGDGGTSGSVVGDVNNNGSLVADRSDALTLSGAISGTGSLTQAGTGTTILTGDNTYTGGTTISAGTLQLGDGGATGSIVGDVTNNAALVINQSGTAVLPGTISGTGSLTQSGSGTTVLVADNTYTGGTTIAAGTLQLGNGGTTGSVAGDITNNGTLSFNRADTVTVDNLISGTGGLTQIGSGMLNLEGIQTYTGPTTVSNGTLAVNGSITSDTTVAAAGTLAGFGTIFGNAENQGTVRPGSAVTGSSNYGTLTIHGNYIGSNGTLALNTYLGGDGSPSDRLVIDGGSATGTTDILINNTSTAGSVYTTGDGIELIAATNGGSTGANAFSLANAARSGFADYRLFRGGLNGDNPDNWFLRNTFTVVPPDPVNPTDPVDPVTPILLPDPVEGILPPGTYPIIGPQIATYAAVQPIARQLGLLTLGTKDERVGEDASGNGASTSSAGWARVFNSYANNQYQSFASPNVKGNLTGFQVGADMWQGVANSAGKQDKAGVYAAFSNANMNVDGLVTNADATGYVRERTGNLNLNAWSGGAYWTHYGADGWYLDGVLQATHYSGSASTANANLSTNGLGILGSVETGYAFSLPQFGTSFKLEPQAQLVWQRVNFDDRNDGLGDVALGTTNGLSGRLGLLAKWQVKSASGQVWQPSLVTNLWKDAGTNANTVYSGTSSVPLAANGSRLEMGGGVTTKINDKFSLYANATYQFGLNNADRQKREGINAAAGLRFAW